MIKMMPLKRLIILTFLFVATLASAQHCRKIDIDKSSGFCTVPDPKLTPGEMDASLACVSNTERPRSVTIAEKNTILAAYSYPANTKKSSGEFDHWLPHWMGGSDTQENILVRAARWKVWLIHKRQSGSLVVAKSVHK
jgi:hypothetical protein